MHGSISIENISFLRNRDIKTTNAKSVTDASNWVMFMSKSLLNSPIIIPAVDFISGQPMSLTNPFHRIPGQFVNKTGKGHFCDYSHFN